MTSIVDIFDSSLRLPDKVCIVAPGINGRTFYASIPPEFYVIAVSKAVLIPDTEPKLWMMNHADQDWYPQANKRFEGIRVFGNRAIYDAGSSLVETKDCYSFTPLGGEKSLGHCPEVEGVIRTGGSVLGNALQFAYNFGAREILLCGADLSGDDYFDDTSNIQPEHGEVWPMVTNLNPMIDWMIKIKGIEISTLSPTKLDVSFYGGG
jgi:hypothetical protein